ncbi:ATP-binding protein [Streptomyces sulfonofaciens]|uniref:ATP-binding protein n=1 Tax=Streptomyces sulfonofaciens TaxID=68272 RepID=A0A919L2U3_9ACTN|nr:FxSxx-COOH system tetratricopeptide repeat protein [Streptomyces sulfonofaciens]GHH81837.1 ATP-binding protein [Streptomyces sulfonofaciens]
MTSGQVDSAHVTVVFAGQSESWAKWIDHQVRRAGRPSTLVRWNPLRRPAGTDGLTDLLAAPGRLLLVIDDWYDQLSTPRFQTWARILRDVLPQYRDRIAAVSVTTRPMPDEVIALAPVGLRGLGPDAARARVLECAGIPAPDTLVSLSRGPRFPDDPLAVWEAPRRNRRFVGRTELLEEVYGKLSAPGDAVALYGPGGIGKTQLALEYVHRFSGEYDIVWWVAAAGRVAAAREHFARIAPGLGLDEHGRLETTIKAVKRELNQTSRPWLLVFDGAGSPERLQDLIPGGRGHVLITTQNTEWAAYAEPIAVPAFQREESVTFVSRRTRRLTDEQADRLAAAVEDMPLLLDQTSAWLDLNPTASVNGYIGDIRHGNPGQFEVVPSPNYPQSFQVAWAKLLNTLRENSVAAWRLLNLLAHFSPDLVPVRLLATARPGDLPPDLQELVSEPSSWNSALRRLSQITSMRVEYEQGPRMDIQTVGTLRMHRLFHEYVRSVQSPQDARVYSAIARKVLVSADPRDPASPANWARYAELIPHLEPSGALTADDPTVRDLVLTCIEYQRMRGEHEDGLWLSRQAVDHWRTASGYTDRAVLVAVHQLAGMLRRLGRYTEAEALGRDTLNRLQEAARVPASGGRPGGTPSDGTRFVLTDGTPPNGTPVPGTVGGAPGTVATHGVRPIELIRAEDSLAGTLMALGRFDEARTLFERAAARATETLGGENVPRTLSIRTNLAIAVGLQGRYAESLALHRRILEARVDLLGGKNALTLNSALCTARMLRLLGRYREALAEQEHNSRLFGQVLDRQHGDTLASEHNLAQCARRVGDLQFAQAMLRSVREKLLARRGTSDPQALMVSCDYAMLQRDLGRLGEARELAETTADRYAALLGPLHPYTVGARDNVSVLMGDMGETAGALKLSEHTTRGMEQAVGRDHPWAIGCALNRAAALAAAGDTEAAAELGRDALARSAGTLGEPHVLTTVLKAGLALDLSSLGRQDEAEGLNREAVGRLVHLLGPSHPLTRHVGEHRRPFWDFEPQPI